jgi:putative ABC transport system substrate-binding protein
VVHQKPDLIFAGTSRIVHALKLATTTIPIVGVMADPVAGRIVESLGRPGGNITGVPGIEISGKQLELLKELLPQPSPVVTSFRGACGKARTVWLREKQHSACESLLLAQF